MNVKKGGSAFIPTLNGGDFPLRPLHPHKLNCNFMTIQHKPIIMPFSALTGECSSADRETPASGGEEGYRRLNRKCMLSMYISHALSYAVLLAAYFAVRT